MPISLSLHLCVSCSYSYTCSSSSRMLLALPHSRPRPQHLMSEHPRFFNPQLFVISQQTTFLVLFFLKNGEKKDAYGVAPHWVKSLTEVSQSVVPRTVIVTTRSELSVQHLTQSCSIRLNGIQIGHATLFIRSLYPLTSGWSPGNNPNSCFTRLNDIPEDQLDMSLSSQSSEVGSTWIIGTWFEIGISKSAFGIQSATNCAHSD